MFIHQPPTYFQATRHPRSCLYFLLPLLAAYELGILWLGGTNTDAVRNAADTWLRWGLQIFGLRAMVGPPVLIIVVFMVWSWWRRFDRPADSLGVWLGMVVESVIFALLLWGFAMAQPSLSKCFTAAISSHSALTTQHSPFTKQHLALIVAFVGAGIYEELLFRLLLYSALRGLLGLTELLRPIAVAAAMLLSAVAFAAAHHLGPYGEPWVAHIFCFRLLAGLFFSGLFQFRGFGVAVGAHVCYDVLVGAAMV